MIRCAVLGAGGQLGKSFEFIHKKFPIDCHFFHKSELDILNDSLDILRSFEVVVNCAAYTKVDHAEQDRETAFAINSTAVERIGRQLSQDQFLFHFSTDYVYHNQLRRPLVETDPCEPKGVYAQSKLHGESKLEQYNAAIFRVSWLYAYHSKNFVNTMLNLFENREVVNVVNDQIGAPTYTSHLAEDVLRIIQNRNFHTGIFNYSNFGAISWYDFANAIKLYSASDIKLVPIPTTEYPTPAKRPPYSVLDHNKFQRKFSLPIRHWKEGLYQCFLEKQNERP